MENYNDFYVYGLAPEVVNQLEPVFFDSAARPAPPPADFQWDHVPRQPKLPEIVYPKKRQEVKKEEEEPTEKHDLPEILEKTTLEDDSLDLEPETEAYEVSTQTSYLNSRSPFIYFESKIPLKDPKNRLTVYKSLFSAEELRNPVRALKDYASQKGQISAVFMVGGGHFVAAIISHDRRHIKNVVKPSEWEQILPQTVLLLDHKTSHRYTTRRKQGGAQSAMDNAKGKANSAGSSLRRYNEQALEQEIKETVQEWEGYLKACRLIYIKASNSRNFQLIVSGDGGEKKGQFQLHKGDPRIRTFPFSTARPTIMAVKKAWVELTYLHPRPLPKEDTSGEAEAARRRQLEASRTQKTKKAGPTKPSAEETLTQTLIQALRRSKAINLIKEVKKSKIDVNFRLVPLEKYKKTPTLLHYASEEGLSFMVYTLLFNLKADPTTLSDSGRTAFQLAKDQDVVHAFQRARGKLGEEYCDWVEGARMDVGAMSEEEWDRLKDHEREAKKKAEKIEKPEEKLEVSTSFDREILQGLSEDDRRRIERERRVRALEKRLGRKL